jgi:hypothetical protein
MNESVVRLSYIRKEHDNFVCACPRCKRNAWFSYDNPGFLMLGIKSLQALCPRFKHQAGLLTFTPRRI